MSTTTEQNGKKLLNKGGVQKVAEGSYLVEGSKGTLYEVTVDSAVPCGWFCRNTINMGACPGWKFAQDHQCKHVYAVKLKEKFLKSLPREQRESNW